jgi:hypothetical protein
MTDMTDDVKTRRGLKTREADADYMQLCADAVQGNDLEDLANAIWLIDAVSESPRFDEVMRYSDSTASASRPPWWN